MTERPWFVRWPQCLERELQALRHNGVDVRVDEEAERAGVLKLHLDTPSSHAGGAHRLTAIYPMEYPFFRPVVVAADLDLPRHQNPFNKELCLLGSSSAQWDPEWTLATLLDRQLPEVLTRGQIGDPDAVAADPAEQAEPRSAYYPWSPGEYVLVDPVQPVPSGAIHGLLELGLSGDNGFRGCLRTVTDQGKERVYEGAPAPESRFPTEVRGRWFRTDEWPPSNSAQDIYAWVRTKSPGAAKPVISKNGVEIIGILCAEEGERGLADGWLFLVRRRGPKGQVTPWRLVGAHRYSEGALFGRAPELAFLRKATVVQAGIGCVGAPIALELARSGVKELSLADGDSVEAATTPRWPLGLDAAAHSKVRMLEAAIGRDYPHTGVRAVPWRIGEPVDPSTTSKGQLEFLTGAQRKWLHGADLILDTTAEWAVAFYLSEIAAELGVPYVMVAGTQGGWGGRIYRVLPGGNGPCWGCIERWRDAGELPTPAAAPDELGRVQPPGCADPTFTGAGFDLGQVALAGARFVIQTLATRLGGEYPDVDWNYAVVSLRDEAGKAIAPRWQTVSLDRFPGCPQCGTR
jgi:hypothetical protein